jgi:hypothetical protein
MTETTDESLSRDPTTTYVDLTALHARHAHEKVLGNFWRSDGYKAAESVLTHKGFIARARGETPAAGRKALTLVHPLVAVEFFRWVSPTLHQQRLYKALFETAPTPQ